MKIFPYVMVRTASATHRPWRIVTQALLVFVALVVIQPAVHARDCSMTSVGMTPINDLGNGSYLNYRGGLYPDGSNLRPPAHESAGLALARSIEPVDSSGNPDTNGKYVLLSIGMSNANQEFEVFRTDADAGRDKHPDLVIVNGAQGGATAMAWADASSPVWSGAMQALSRSNVSPNQVSVVWAKLANSASDESPETYRVALQRDVENVANVLYDKFPNLKLVYLASRIYAGYATSPLNPEPFAYESGFVVKTLIEKQLNGNAALNFDPANGPVNTPWLSWGPYLWADGLMPRSDGLVWECDELREDDGTHPSDAGMQKVATILLDFFKTDSTSAEWFLGGPVDSVAPAPPENLVVDP
jgi:hypothetical protein